MKRIQRGSLFFVAEFSKCYYANVNALSIEKENFARYIAGSFLSMSITIREVTRNDAVSIAMLHAASWRSTYRGILSDTYLDNDLLSERERYWRPKLDNLKSNEFVLLAMRENEPAGFIAVLDRPEAACDALIDNLHVRGDAKGLGIGGKLMKAAAERLRATGRGSVYLWVLNGNDAAAEFYKRKGASIADTAAVMFGGKEVLQTRFVWRDLNVLISEVR